MDENEKLIVVKYTVAEADQLLKLLDVAIRQVGLEGVKPVNMLMDKILTGTRE